MTQIINIIIRSPEEILFQGTAESLSTFNEKGPLDVLPFHENFISIIQKEVTIHLKSEKKSFPVDYGILKITSNEVNVLLGIEAVETPLS